MKSEAVKLCDWGCGQEATYQFKNGRWCCSTNVARCPINKTIMSCKMKGKNNPKPKPSIYLNLDGKLCDYGCGQEAKYKFKNGKFCCSERFISCPNSKKTRGFANKHHCKETIEKMKIDRSGEGNGMFGKHQSEYTIMLIKNDHIGKTWKEIFGVNKANVLRKQQRIRMLNGLSLYASSFIKNPSRPQVELFNRIKKLHPSAILNYPCYQLNFSLDIAIPDLMICFESDGSYWHKDQEKDLIRQKQIEGLGWKVIRYFPVDTIQQVPSIDQIKKDIENIIENKK